MRASWWLLGAAAGAGAAYALLRRNRKQNAPALEQPHRIQSEKEAEQVKALLEDVAHRPDIPDTPVKHAFEEALHPHER